MPLFSASSRRSHKRQACSNSSSHVRRRPTDRADGDHVRAWPNLCRIRAIRPSWPPQDSSVGTSRTKVSSPHLITLSRSWLVPVSLVQLVVAKNNRRALCGCSRAVGIRPSGFQAPVSLVDLKRVTVEVDLNCSQCTLLSRVFMLTHVSLECSSCHSALAGERTAEPNETPDFTAEHCGLAASSRLVHS